MTLLVCGSRDWVDAGIIADALKYAVREWGVERVVEGGQRGADTLGGVFAAQLLGWSRVMVVTADWRRHGRAAGPRRNQRMLDIANPDCVLAFHDDPGLGTGTRDMVQRAERHGIPVFLCTTAQPTPTPFSLGSAVSPALPDAGADMRKLESEDEGFGKI